MTEETKARAKTTLSKLTNRKILLGVGTILVCIVLIAVCSFMPFIIDPKQWQTTEFLTNQLITIAIVISALVGTIFIGQASNAQDPRSNLSKARTAFFQTVVQVNENVNRFTQWVREVLQKNDLVLMKKRKLRAVGIDDISILDLEYSEIRALLETPQKYGDKFYKGLSQEQIDVVLEVKGHKKKIQFVTPDYYLSVKNIIDNRTISERSANESLKKGLYLTRSIIGKVIVTLVTSMIFASLIRDLNDVDKAKAWLNFIARLWAMMTSIFMGYINGCQINDIDAEYVEMRTEVHRMYLQDTEFVEIPLQEQAKMEYIERVRKEQVLPNLIEEKKDLDTDLPVKVEPKKTKSAKTKSTKTKKKGK